MTTKATEAAEKWAKENHWMNYANCYREEAFLAGAEFGDAQGYARAVSEAKMLIDISSHQDHENDRLEQEIAQLKQANAELVEALVRIKNGPEIPLFYTHTPTVKELAEFTASWSQETAEKALAAARKEKA